jgi:hypothetical protein
MVKENQKKKLKRNSIMIFSFLLLQSRIIKEIAIIHKFFFVITI